MGPAGAWAGQGEEPAGGQHRCPLLCRPAPGPTGTPYWGKPRKAKKTLTQKTHSRGGCFVHGAPVRQVGTLGSPSAHGGGHLLRGEGPLSPGLDLPHRVPAPLPSHGIQTVLSLQKLGARVSSWPPPWSPVEAMEGNPSSGLGRARSRCGTMTASPQSTGEDTLMLLAHHASVQDKTLRWTRPVWNVAWGPSASPRTPRDTACRENAPSLGIFPPPFHT